MRPLFPFLTFALLVLGSVAPPAVAKPNVLMI